MNKIAITSLALLLVTGSAYAIPPAGGPCGGPSVERLQKKLELSDEQAASVKTLLEEQREKRRTLHESHREELDQHQTETRERLSAVLTEEQLEKLDSFKEQRKERRGRRW